MIERRHQTRRPPSLNRQDFLRLTIAVALVLLAATTWRHSQTEAPSVRAISAQHHQVPANELPSGGWLDPSA
ncbi:hypothetical protein HBA54_20080 [Pelagibius litoralis]|uniref:Uncharacterized protein n=1 Tax=Pelagibius litoralis TaxID=374515 RepID=A0A967K995_9PROT|nr:hypothetical protein [Pelagibius litoralis]NIA70903.1 hypothetical protein [Pelagibius litoralis]